MTCDNNHALLKKELLPPCVRACPAGADIGAVLRLAREKKFEQAVRRLWERNPFPATAGRVCGKPCENACLLGPAGGAVHAAGVERFLGDWANAADLVPCPGPDKKTKISIVGSGPAGLSAAFYLRLLGHGVTVYEAEEYAGGLMRLGISEFRLPHGVFVKDFKRLERMGINFVTKTRVSSPEELLKSVDAVILAVGRCASRKMGVPGEDLPGVYDGFSLLRAARLLLDFPRGRSAVVIGGGNTAIDCAQTLLRVGRDVKVTYRGEQSEMPAFAEHVTEAAEEGVHFEFNVLPVKIEKRGESLTVTFARVKNPGNGSSSKLLPDSEFVLECDFVIRAVGGILSDSCRRDKIKTDETGIRVDGRFRTSVKGIYACGRCSGSGASVPAAVSAGRGCAYCLDSELSGSFGDNAVSEVEPCAVPAPPDLMKQEGSKRNSAPRVPEKKSPPQARARDFREIRLGITEENVGYECGRCLRCPGEPVKR